MTEIKASDEVAAFLRSLKEPTELLNSHGQVFGVFEPAINAGEELPQKAFEEDNPDQQRERSDLSEDGSTT